MTVRVCRNGRPRGIRALAARRDDWFIKGLARPRLKINRATKTARHPMNAAKCIAVSRFSCLIPALPIGADGLLKSLTFIASAQPKETTETPIEIAKPAPNAWAELPFVGAQGFRDHL